MTTRHGQAQVIIGFLIFCGLTNRMKYSSHPHLACKALVYYGCFAELSALSSHSLEYILVQILYRFTGSVPDMSLEAPSP